MMKLLKKPTTYFYIVLFICLASCIKKEQTKPKKIKSLKVLIAKTIETRNATALSSGFTNYKLAFNDGYTNTTSFGYYSCLQIGDTITFIKDEGDSDFWLIMKPNCK